ncbi:MAG: cytochrome c [Candidatus Brocadiales bacterium]
MGKRKAAIGLAHYIWFASLGTALFLSFIWLCLDEYVRDWKNHQVIVQRIQVKALNDRIDAIDSELHNTMDDLRKKKLKSTMERMNMVLAQIKTRPKKIQQLEIHALDKIDRCTTCHIAIDDKNVIGEEHPAGGHPGEYLKWHDIDEYGCTICHEGQGLSTDYMQAAHEPIKGFDRPWEAAVLTEYFIESSCGKCHLDREVPFAPMLTQGRHLIELAGCYGCHEVPLFKDEPKVAPRLDGLGVKVNMPWLLNWLHDPREYEDSKKLVRHRMPRFNISKEEIVDLATFLMETDEKPLEPAPLDDDPDAGGLLFRESRCVTCHTIEGKGGYLGPELSLITTKVNKGWMYNWIKNNHHFQPKTKMPQFNFNDQQCMNIVSYFWEEFGEDPPELPEGFEEVLKAEAKKEDRIARGKKLFSERGCTGCHDKAGFKTEKIAPPLEGVGSRSEYLLNWGEVEGIEKYLGDWLYVKVEGPATMDPKAKMPNFQLKPGEVGAITIALLSYTEEKIPHNYIVPAKSKAYPELPGRMNRIVDRFRCRSCHVIYGEGGWVSGHPLDSEGSEVQKPWLRAYFDLPYTLRPILRERMINLRMEPETADYLASFLKTVMINNTIPDMDEESFTEEQVEKGKELFKEKGCRSCHILGEGGGYVGPPMTEVGDRLTPGWIYAYTKDPNHYQPWAIQPDYGFTEDDSTAMAAYLMTWKKKKKEEEAKEEVEVKAQAGVKVETGVKEKAEVKEQTEEKKAPEAPVAPVAPEEKEAKAEQVSSLGAGIQPGG